MYFWIKSLWDVNLEYVDAKVRIDFSLILSLTCPLLFGILDANKSFLKLHFLFKISDILSKYNVDINTTMSGEDCIYKIKSGEIYNLIIIDDELKNESALGTLEELKKNKEFNSKVIVMLEIGKKHLRNHYIEDGFTDVILKENLKDELKEKIESNL